MIYILYINYQNEDEITKNQIELEKIGVPKYEDLSIYQEPGLCPDRPNENYLLLSDLPNYKDEGSSGLWFLTKNFLVKKTIIFILNRDN